MPAFNAFCRAAFAATGIAAATPAFAGEVVVFAPASLKTGLDNFAAAWEAKTGHGVTLTYAGSNQLARQIIDGAPADIFISAAVNWMDEVQKAGLIAGELRRDILGNTLVLVAAGKDAPPMEIRAGFDLKGALGDGKLAMALVDSVPAGQYGKAALTALGVWDAVAPSVAQADNVRAALRLVATGEAPYGVVYATDASAEDSVKVVGTFPADSHPPILYPAALLANAADEADKAFFEALSGEEADAAFAEQGFKILD